MEGVALRAIAAAQLPVTNGGKVRVGYRLNVNITACREEREKRKCAHSLVNAHIRVPQVFQGGRNTPTAARLVHHCSHDIHHHVLIDVDTEEVPRTLRVRRVNVPREKD